MKKLIMALIICAAVLVGCKSSAATMNAPSATADITPSAAPAAETSPSAAEPTPTATPSPTDHPEVTVEPPVGDVVEIREKLFIAQTNDIYYNAEDYLGKTIKYEGIFNVNRSLDGDVLFCSVYRYGPGCCGDDGYAGFEVRWDGEYPNSNDWVEAIGILEEYEEEGYLFLRVALTSLTVLPTRGTEYVTQ